MAKKLYKCIPMAFFGAYFLKSIILSATITDAYILLILASYTAYNEYKKDNEEMKLITDRLEKQEKEVDNIRTQLASVKLGTAMRTMGSGR